MQRLLISFRNPFSVLKKPTLQIQDCKISMYKFLQPCNLGFAFSKSVDVSAVSKGGAEEPLPLGEPRYL